MPTVVGTISVRSTSGRGARSSSRGTWTAKTKVTSVIGRKDRPARSGVQW